MKSVIWKKNLAGWLSRKIFEIFWLEIKQIPDDELIWRSVYNKHQIKDDGTLKSSFFRDRNGLSCDIAKFTTIEKARRGRGIPPRWPESSGLVQFKVLDIREQKINSDIKHDPISDKPKNYSHCILTTTLTEGQSKLMKQKSQLIIKPTFLE